MKIPTLISALLVLTAFNLNAQHIHHDTISIETLGKSLREIISQLKSEQKVKCFSLDSWIEGIQSTKDFKGQTIGDMLSELLDGTDLSFIQMYPQTYVILKDPQQEINRKSILFRAEQEKKQIVQVTLGESTSSPHESITLVGIVRDAKTQEPLIGVNIQVLNSTSGTTTNQQGAFKLVLPNGAYVLSISQLDYETKVLDLKAYRSGELSLTLDKKAIVLQEVIVQAQSISEISNNRIGQIQIGMKELKRAPSFLGESDLIKQVQNLPGVTTVGEAAAGFNVRGGSVDQNLIILDGIPVLNSAHVFGFLSAFNSETLRDVNFYRSGIPAEFGGRVSSVLNINTKDGSLERWSGNAGIGLVASHAMVEGPIKKDKTSMLASFRSTYSNWLVNSIRTDYVDLRNSKVSFYDGTFKLTHRVSDRTRVSITQYLSADGFRLTGDTTYRWKTNLSSFNINHEFTPELNAEFVFGTSQYGYLVENSNKLTASNLSYQLNTHVAKATFHYSKGIRKLTFGWQLTHYRFQPGRLQPQSEISNAKSISLSKQYSFENAFFGSQEWSFQNKWFLEGGLRIPLFLSVGSAQLLKYQEGLPLEIANAIDTLQYRRGEIIKPYGGIEPRLSFRWNIQPNASIKLGYQHLYQYLHLVTNTTAVTPVDIWQPSGYYFKPQQADQISLGYFLDDKDKKWSASLEGFYKNVNNIVDFKDGAQLILNKHLETDLLQGNAVSYGIETYLSRNVGRLTGSINYTYSRTFRTIKGLSISESINNGEKYPANFDQPHVLNIGWKYSLSKRHFFTGNFTYHSGRPVTIPLSIFGFENNSIAYFSGRNQYRIPDYHRLDVALVLEGSHKRVKHLEGTWVISIYNVYGRRNPYTIFFKGSNSGIPQPYQLSIIGTIFPSVSYNIKIQ